MIGKSAGSAVGRLQSVVKRESTLIGVCDEPRVQGADVPRIPPLLDTAKAAGM